MAEKLRSYRRKRDFEATPEPAGARERAGGEQARFVVHEHHARRLHWDLRLERDGVLVSWAIPKGIPEDPQRNHLAVHVEDHPLDYIDFAGEIPKGSYGAGKVTIWDAGFYEAEKFREDEVIATFHGDRLRGRYALFQTRGQDWMIHRMDPPADPGRQPPPERLRPMLARAGDLPDDDAAHGYEVKWDGVRAIVTVEGGRPRAHSRSLAEITHRYPELRDLGRALGSREVVLDGELVAFDEEGRPSFERLQRRMHVDSETQIRRLAREVPVVYVIFDLLHEEGRSTLDLPYRERRERLEALALAGQSWQTPAYHAGDGAAVLEASAAQGLEGMVAKRLDSSYEPGRRSGAWVKVKHRRTARLLVAGWMPGKGARGGRIGSLLLGYRDPEDPDRLLYAGNVGSGFTEAELARVAGLLEPLRRRTSPFSGRQPPREAVFAEPRLVAEVGFTEWTRSGTLRHPTYLGLADADPASLEDRPGTA